MISVVCVFNDKQKLERFLLRSLQRQTVGYEPCLVDNSSGRFKSASQGLNFGAKGAKGDYILFVHQDVALGTDDWLKSVELLIRELPYLGIVGVAGKVSKGDEVYTNVMHGSVPYFAGRKRVMKPMKVQTLDELLAIIPRQVFEKHVFNSELCQDWHLYVVEYCLRMKRIGLDSYVIPNQVYHWAELTGHLSEEYFSSLRRLLSHYKEYRHIATTCGDWSTRLPVRWQRGEISRLVFRIRRGLMQ